MYSISEKIDIKKQGAISNKIFRNEEIGKRVIVKFDCCNCGYQNKIAITPYESGFPIIQVYEENKILSKNELLENKMLSVTSHWMQHFGDLTLNDLPTLYFGTDCENCSSKYIVIFCYGEKQPGMTLLEISGVWEYEIIKTI